MKCKGLGEKLTPPKVNCCLSLASVLWTQCIVSYSKAHYRTSDQDGDIGRYTSPPHTNKRDNNKFKNKNNQNCQKIELNGSLTTKELKKKHSSRLIGGMERRGGDQQTGWKGHVVRQWLVVPHLHADKLGRTTWEGDRPSNQGFQHGKRKPQNFWL